MPLQLPKETQKLVLASVKRFALEELELNLGEIKAGLVLDFFLQEIAPTIYNQALDDAGRFFAEKVEDLPGRHQKEFGYWVK